MNSLYGLETCLSSLVTDALSPFVSFVPGPWKGMGEISLYLNPAASKFARECEASVTQTYIILQLTDNEADSVKLLVPGGQKNEKKAFFLRVKAGSGIKLPQQTNLTLKNYFFRFLKCRI